MVCFKATDLPPTTIPTATTVEALRLRMLNIARADKTTMNLPVPCHTVPQSSLLRFSPEELFISALEEEFVEPLLEISMLR